MNASSTRQANPDRGLASGQALSPSSGQGAGQSAGYVPTPGVISGGSMAGIVGIVETMGAERGMTRAQIDAKIEQIEEESHRLKDEVSPLREVRYIALFAELFRRCEDADLSRTIVPAAIAKLLINNETFKKATFAYMAECDEDFSPYCLGEHVSELQDEEREPSPTEQAVGDLVWARRVGREQDVPEIIDRIVEAFNFDPSFQRCVYSNC